MLSFLVIKEQENVYRSICIRLCINGGGESPEEARENMKDHVFDFPYENFAEEWALGFAWEHLKDVSF
ncbi:MAG: hypothetical protein LBB48_01560 [Treponema sp.]|jgi:hypothetical protein|nr:hypothetical protein [Treponema sp.]